MSTSRLPSGRFRAQVWSPVEGKTVSAAAVLGLPERSFSSERLAKDAVTDARRKLRANQACQITVAEWGERWLEDPLYAGQRKESTAKQYRQRVRQFVGEHGDMPLSEVSDQTVAEWIAGGRNLSTVPVLKAMFNDAASATAGRLIPLNPWQGLRLSHPKRREEHPPSEAEIEDMLAASFGISHGFGAWMQAACWLGMRPGELDSLQWDRVDFERDRVHVEDQWNERVRKFTTPKNNKVRTIRLTPQAKTALMNAPRASRFCFTNFRGDHWTGSSREKHWDRVRGQMGWLHGDDRRTLYGCTRHFCGWYLWNVLELPAEDVAIQLGHEDHGELVRTTYGHRDRDMVLDRIGLAFSRVNNLAPLRAVE